jgi:hypothetical protein
MAGMAALEKIMVAYGLKMLGLERGTEDVSLALYLYFRFVSLTWDILSSCLPFLFLRL